MNRTLEHLLTWAPLGAAVALMLSDHKRLALAVAAVSPITVAVQHPRGTRRALRAVPRGLKQAGEGVARGGREAGRGLRWLAS